MCIYNMHRKIHSYRMTNHKCCDNITVTNHTCAIISTYLHIWHVQEQDVLLRVLLHILLIGEVDACIL